MGFLGRLHRDLGNSSKVGAVCVEAPAAVSFLRRTSEQHIRHVGVSFHVEPLALQAKSKAQ
jgi:hypothetical protein